MKNSKWIEVYESLKKSIETRNYQQDEIFCTISSVSEQFNVSSITSRKALSTLASEKLIIQKPGVGAVIRPSRINNINFFIADQWNTSNFGNLPIIYFEILKGAIQEAANEGIEIEFIRERELLRQGGKIPVLLFYDDEKICIKAKALQKGCSMLVFLHSPMPLKDFHAVRHNLRKASYCATKHLISKGHRRIGFLTGHLKHKYSLPRFEGYFDALKESNIPFDLSLIRETFGLKKENFEALEKLLSMKEPPTSIFAGNDRRALDILEHCAQQGIKIPEDLAVCGIDNIAESALSKPSLTTVDTGWRKIGKEAVKLAVDLMENPAEEIKDVVIEPKLAVRDST